MSTAQALPTVFSGSNTAGKAPSTPSSPRNNAAQAPTALRTPTTALSVISSAPSRRLPIRSLLRMSSPSLTASASLVANPRP